MRKWMLIAVAVALVAWLGMAGSAAAKGKGNKGDVCRKAEQALARTGVGDSDGDGISDCRETRVLSTDPRNPDTDDDGLDDGDDFGKACNPKDEDTDDDGVPDGDDPTPVVTQKLVALLDTLTCPVAAVVDPPTPAVAGSIGALGTTAILTTDTQFRGKTCEELAAQLALNEGNLLVKVRILENTLGELNARSVTILQGCRRPDHHHGWWPHEHDEDEDDDDGDDD